MSARRRVRVTAERGAALIIALLVTLLLSALGAALVLLSATETAIGSNYRTALEALYAADAGLERAIQELRTVPGWSDVLAGRLKASFADNTNRPTLPDGSPLDLAEATISLQDETDSLKLWGANSPVWRLYAYGPLTALLPAGAIDSPMYVAVWVGDDPSETDGDPNRDGNGMVTLHARAYGVSHAQKVVEATLARTPSPQEESEESTADGEETLDQSPRRPGVQILSWRELR